MINEPNRNHLVVNIKNFGWGEGSPTFRLVGVRRGDVLGEHPQALLALVMQPQIHLPPRLVLLRSLSLEVPLTVAHPQLVRVLREPLKEDASTRRVISVHWLTTHFMP